MVVGPRPYLTAGVVLAGTSLIAITPSSPITAPSQLANLGVHLTSSDGFDVSELLNAPVSLFHNVANIPTNLFESPTGVASLIADLTTGGQAPADSSDQGALDLYSGTGEAFHDATTNVADNDFVTDDASGQFGVSQFDVSLQQLMQQLIDGDSDVTGVTGDDVAANPLGSDTPLGYVFDGGADHLNPDVSANTATTYGFDDFFDSLTQNPTDDPTQTLDPSAIEHAIEAATANLDSGTDTSVFQGGSDLIPASVTQEISDIVNQMTGPDSQLAHELASMLTQFDNELHSLVDSFLSDGIPFDPTDIAELAADPTHYVSPEELF